MQATFLRFRRTNRAQDIVPGRKIRARMRCVIVDQFLGGKPLSAGDFLCRYQLRAADQYRLLIHQPAFVHTGPVSLAAADTDIRLAVRHVHQLLRHVKTQVDCFMGF